MGAERKIVQNAVSRGKRRDNKILKVQILLSKNFVVIAQAPTFPCFFGPKFSLVLPRKLMVYTIVFFAL